MAQLLLTFLIIFINVCSVCFLDFRMPFRIAITMLLRIRFAHTFICIVHIDICWFQYLYMNECVEVCSPVRLCFKINGHKGHIYFSKRDSNITHIYIYTYVDIFKYVCMDIRSCFQTHLLRNADINCDHYWRSCETYKCTSTMHIHIYTNIYNTYKYMCLYKFS